MLCLVGAKRQDEQIYNTARDVQIQRDVFLKRAGRMGVECVLRLCSEMLWRVGVVPDAGHPALMRVIRSAAKDLVLR